MLSTKTRTFDENRERAINFVHQTVQTTDAPPKQGRVTSAAVGRDGVINLTVRGDNGVEFSTDNEHSTIV